MDLSNIYLMLPKQSIYLCVATLIHPPLKFGGEATGGETTRDEKSWGETSRGGKTPRNRPGVNCPV